LPGLCLTPLAVGIIAGGTLTLGIDPFAFLFGLCVAAVALALGVPAELLLERLGWVDWRLYLGLGAFVGGVLPGLFAVPAYLLVPGGRVNGALAGLAVALFGCAVLGAIAALVFWAAARPIASREPRGRACRVSRSFRRHSGRALGSRPIPAAAMRLLYRAGKPMTIHQVSKPPGPAPACG
jgi:hypothetical protein